MEPNPYASPSGTIGSAAPLTSRWRLSLILPTIVAAILSLAALTGLVVVPFPAAARIISPRFGGIGLILCLNPLIFLYAWFRHRQVNSLIAGASLTGFIAFIHTMNLLSTGTVAEVKQFSDQLHSSWFYRVLSMLILSALLFIAAWDAKRDQPKP